MRSDPPSFLEGDSSAFTFALLHRPLPACIPSRYTPNSVRARFRKPAGVDEFQKVLKTS
jgi:hypothetical protein